MNWIESLFFGENTAHNILLFALVIAGGILLGKIRIKGISLGITFVLFVGIFAGHLGMKIDHEVLHFMKEFGLILFIYSVGLQVGPGFLSSFKKGGMKLNMLAAGTVLLGVAVTIILHFVTDLPMPTMVGIMSGAVTNTPGLGAAQETLYGTIGTTDATIAMGYAIAYPLAIVGIIGSIILIRYIFRVNMSAESEKLHQGAANEMHVERITLEVRNPAIFGMTIQKVADLLAGNKFIVSRILHRQNEQMEIASPATVLEEGDRILIITTLAHRPTVIAFVGKEVEEMQK